MTNKEQIIASEADNWFKRNIKDLEKNFNPYPSSILVEWLNSYENAPQNNMLEIGCGPGFNLDFLSASLNMKGYGIEPSRLSIEYAQKHFPNITVFSGTADDLSDLESDCIEYVHLGFFMYLVDDIYIDAVVSESSRVLKNGGFLSILDFDVMKPSTKEDSHSKNLMIFKRDQSEAFLNSNRFALINKHTFSSLNHKEIDLDTDRFSLQLLTKRAKD